MRTNFVNKLYFGDAHMKKYYMMEIFLIKLKKHFLMTIMMFVQYHYEPYKEHFTKLIQQLTKIYTKSFLNIKSIYHYCRRPNGCGIADQLLLAQLKLYNML